MKTITSANDLFDIAYQDIEEAIRIARNVAKRQGLGEDPTIIMRTAELIVAQWNKYVDGADV
jgi:hypothetical protein